MSRKKIIIHIYPDEYTQDTYASNLIDSLTTAKGDFYRNCFLAGVALSKIDKNLPSVLSNVLSDKTDKQTFLKILQILDIINIEKNDNYTQKTTIENTAKNKGKELFFGKTDKT